MGKLLRPGQIKTGSKKPSLTSMSSNNASTQQQMQNAQMQNAITADFGDTVDLSIAARQDPTWNDIPTGRRFAPSYEAQTGKPIDGGSEQLRNFAPFVISFALPDDLADSFDHLNKNAKKVTTFDSVEAIDADSLFVIKSAYDNATGLPSLNYSQSYLEEAAFQQFANPNPEPAFVGTIQVVNYVTQLLQLLKMPALQVLVNPVSMSITYTKIQEFSARTRKNRVFRAWGQEQPTITFSFSTGGFIAGQERHFWSSVENTPSGLQYASKKRSAAWQNFMKIFQTFIKKFIFFIMEKR